MQKKPLAIYVWPGLPQIWARGSWSALGVAALAAALLSAAMLLSFGWSELIDPGLRKSLWVSLAIVWGGASIVSAIMLKRQGAARENGSSKDLFNQAVDVYLIGDYYQAERLLSKLLDNDVRDLDARLLLATLMRHTARIEEASKQLDQLTCFDGAEKWELEIRTERELLSEAKNKLKDKHANGITIASTVDSGKSVRCA